MEYSPRKVCTTLTNPKSNIHIKKYSKIFNEKSVDKPEANLYSNCFPDRASYRPRPAEAFPLAAVAAAVDTDLDRHDKAVVDQEAVAVGSGDTDDSRKTLIGLLRQS